MASTITSYFTAYNAHSFSDLSTHLSATFTFTDPAFGTLSPVSSRDMFRFFCHPSTTTRTHQIVTIVSPPVATNNPAVPNEYKLVYSCDYYFAPGRKVLNVIDCWITIDVDGKIATQRDEFDVPAWARQAGGWPLWIIVSVVGNAPVRSKARQRLDKWVKDHPEN